MKLLIVTQIVDTQDPVLGFFVRWIEEFSKHTEEVTVICLKKGVYTLPKNVRVFSLGKERAPSMQAHFAHFARRLIYTFRFLNLVWRERTHYDSVFVHMNPGYVVLAGGLWRLTGKRISLWYTHKSVTLTLRVAAFSAHTIFTASRESFRLTSKKVRVVGHGIDVNQFIAPINSFHTPTRIISVGRITPIKNLDILIEAAAFLRADGFKIEVTLIGSPAKPTDEVYLDSLKHLAKNHGISGRVHFVGSIPHEQMPEFLRDFDIAVNLSPTGGMDKVVLESMAAGLLVFVSNKTFINLFTDMVDNLIFKECDARDCADKIERVLSSDTCSEYLLREQLIQNVRKMSIENVVSNIISEIQQ